MTTQTHLHQTDEQITAVDGTLSAEPTGQPAGEDSGRKQSKLRRAVSAVTAVLLGLVMVAMLGLAAVAIVVPKILGATPLTVLTSSMEPTYSPGDVVVVQPVEPQDVAMGDVVTFQPTSDDPTLVTHRVVSIRWGSDGVAGFVTRGDANGADDDPIVPDQVMGRVVYSIPLIGHVTNASWGRTAVTVGAAGLILYAVVMIVTPDRSRRSSAKEAV
jgi:signal peptidase